METSAFDLDSFLQKYKIPLIFSLFGLILLGFGILTIKKFLPQEDKVEISTVAGESVAQNKILADISGGVIKPGVYELVFGSRINDLLVMAGGLSSLADRDWVGKNLNLAQKLSDGAKIYIFKTGELNSSNPSNPSGPSNPPNSSNSSNPPYLQGKININTATVAELDTLWGVGEVTAQKIIAGRPFQKPEDLLYKKIVKSNVWEKIKDLVTVY